MFYRFPLMRDLTPLEVILFSAILRFSSLVHFLMANSLSPESPMLLFQRSSSLSEEKH